MQSVDVAVGYLDGIRLNRCLCASIDWLISAQDELNKINVFPVPDGDTGTNLALTVDSIGVRIQQLKTRHVGELLIKAADAALDGARGNSGAIVAQFFQGLADSCEDKQRLLPKDLVKGFQAGAEYARSAISKPKSGTILTLIDAVAKDLAEYHEKNPERDFVPMLNNAVDRAQVVLAGTQQQLEVLRRAGVVDAGAKGFLLLLEGIGNFLSQGSLRAVPVPRAGPDAAATLTGFEAQEGDIEHRFCTECLVHGEQIDHRKLRERLSEIGSSMIVAGTPRKTKIHIHVDEPSAVFHIAGEFGELTGRKADDMRQQAHAVSAVNKRFAVITDTAADLPDFAMEEYDIHTVPLRIHFGNQRYLDKIDFTPTQFFQEMHTNPEPAQTSQPTPGDYRRMYDYLASHFNHVFCISLSQKVSGTWQAAASAAERAQRPDAITVIDSKTAAVGQGLIALHAAECIAAGMDREEIVASIEAAKDHTQTCALVTDLSYAVKGGRVPPWAYRLSRLLRIHPILHATGDGRVVPGGFVFGGAGTIERFIRYVMKRMNVNENYVLAVAHAQYEDAARQVHDRLRELNPNIKSSYITELGAAVGTHSGPGAVAVAIRCCRPAKKIPAEPAS